MITPVLACCPKHSFSEFDDSSQTAYEAARSEAMIAIKKAFDTRVKVVFGA